MLLLCNVLYCHIKCAIYTQENCVIVNSADLNAKRKQLSEKAMNSCCLLLMRSVDKQFVVPSEPPIIIKQANQFSHLFQTRLNRTATVEKLTEKLTSLVDTSVYSKGAVL